MVIKSSSWILPGEKFMVWAHSTVGHDIGCHPQADAPVFIARRFKFKAGIILPGTNPVAGQIKIGGSEFVNSPVSIETMLYGTVLNIEAEYNGIEMDNLYVTVTEDHTITIRVFDSLIGQPVPTPGTTLIDVDFKPNAPPVIALTKPASTTPLPSSDVTIEGTVFVMLMPIWCLWW